MEKQWQNHGVNLEKLAQAIESYYSRRGFKVKRTVLEDGYSLDLVLRKLRLPGAMSIVIRGAPDDFRIVTNATEHEDEAVKVGLMTMIFGGGSFILVNLKNREELEKLEREFWGSIEERIRLLVNSAGSRA
jgi:hypothetical protein